MAEVFKHNIPYRKNGSSVLVYVVDAAYEDHTVFRPLAEWGSKLAVFHEDADSMQVAELNAVSFEEKRTASEVESAKNRLAFAVDDHQQWAEALRLLEDADD